MLMVRVADWLIAPKPPVDAVTVTVLVPAGVPGFPPVFTELLLLHEIKPAVSTTIASTPAK